MTRAPSAMRLPVRRKNGTPAQRQLSISHRSRDEGLDLGVRRDARLVAVALVLPAHDVAGVDRQQRAEDLELLVDERARLERRRRLHRDEREHLEQVRHDHVAVGAGALVERAARADRQRLGDVDLHVVDVLAVPDRLEEAVGEPQREHVQRRLLAEEVVDAEDLAPRRKTSWTRVVELARRLEVGAERLLHDHARALGQAGLAERPHDRAGGRRRHRQVVQPPRPRSPIASSACVDAGRQRVGLRRARTRAGR